MSAISGLLEVSETYRTARGISSSRLSTIVFGDGKVLPQLASAERDITTKRLENGLRWFADNWPEGVDWPEGVARPAPLESPAALPETA